MRRPTPRMTKGWLYTGDIAKMDEDGYFYIVDRKKDLIIAGGYNIVPREVEEVLFMHPKVLEAVVAGVPRSRARRNGQGLRGAEAGRDRDRR